MHEGRWRRALAQSDPDEIDQSLKRLGTDYVDLYLIHRGILNPD
jgi:aryl-alcohol dehydrogenase-like predicted oxidoreductase